MRARAIPLKRVIPFSLSLALCALVLSAAMPVAARVGARPPDFTLRSVSGGPWRGTFRLREHLGRRPVVLSFFATWCRPCEVELPLLQAAHERHGDDLKIAAIAIDGPESASGIASMVRRLRVRFPVLHDTDSSVTSRYNPRRSVPFLVIIDREGRVRHERDGFSVADQRRLPRALDALVD
ncbi:MAG: TlpA family protein disulfide reductase [Deltaproteobacteria bacterium]|nr:TlpA family protein disulfide reductase [Deltaproteobacteria bacterium]